MERAADRVVERRVMGRISGLLGGVVVECPQFAVCDYLVVADGVVSLGVEVKGRRESEKQVRGYGDLILHHPKVVALLGLRELLRVPIRVMWGFEDGRGPVWSLDVQRLPEVMAARDDWGVTPPPVKREQRAASSDREPVVMVPWALLRRVV